MSGSNLPQGGLVKNSKKTIAKEISLWKKRYNDSKRAFKGVYDEVSRDARKLYREAKK
jgi:hypothetical protein